MRHLLGRRDESAEVIIGTARGVEFSRNLRRKADVDRWSREEYSSFTGVPWHPRGAEVTARRRQLVGGRGRGWEWARLAHLAVLRRVEGGGGINAQGMDGLTGGLTDGQGLWPKARHQLWTWA